MVTVEPTPTGLDILRKDRLIVTVGVDDTIIIYNGLGAGDPLAHIYHTDDGVSIEAFLGHRIIVQGRITILRWKQEGP